MTDCLVVIDVQQGFADTMQRVNVASLAGEFCAVATTEEVTDQMA